MLAAPLACGGRQTVTSSGQTGGVATPADAGARAGDAMAAIAAPAWEGSFHTCVVRSAAGREDAGGPVYCWGANGEGELGDGRREDGYT
ncbi:MAG: hypothetical protein IT379_01275, partial [Deltaproteobacteria bacterium]|nr:hypothetical protein [Deltaproteobacteria bacterium]